MRLRRRQVADGPTFGITEHEQDCSKPSIAGSKSIQLEEVGGDGDESHDWCQHEVFWCSHASGFH